MMTACVSAGAQKRDSFDLNLIPMYGYPQLSKSSELKEADDVFIKGIVNTYGSREKGSKEVAAAGWHFFRSGDAANAMIRFNQSWLLNPDYYGAYWGFGTLLSSQGKASEALTHYEIALLLIDENSQKPKLLNAAAKAYAILGRNASSKKKAKEFFAKANSLFDEAVTLDPEFGDAYNSWIVSLYIEGDYNRAWEIVRKTRDQTRIVVPSDIIDALSKEFPEP